MIENHSQVGHAYSNPQIMQTEDKNEAKFSEHFKDFVTYIKEDRRWLVLIGYVFMISNLYFGYGFAILIPQQMGIDNAYLNGVLIGVADLVGFLVVFAFINRFPRKAFHRFHIWGMIVCAGVLLVIGLMFDKSNEFIKILDTLLSGSG